MEQRARSRERREQRSGFMRRKYLGLALSAMLFALSMSANAQQAKKVPRIGWLTGATLSSNALRTEAFRRGLRELGYVDGKNIVIEWRAADGKLDRLPALASELVRLKVDVIITGGEAATRPDKEATATRPVIALKETQEAARAMGLQIQSLEVRGPKPDLEAALNGAIKGRARALLVINNPLIGVQVIVEQIQKKKIPAIYPDRRFIDDGGLMSYGVDNVRLFSRLAYFVDRILKGAKPEDLPVEQPTKFEFIINLKTATPIGLTLSPDP